MKKQRKKEIRMKDLVVLENGEYSLVNDTINTIITIENEMAKLKEMQDNYKKALLEQMEENNVLKIDVPELTITRTLPTQRETLDTKLLREEKPDVYDEYVKFSEVKGSLRIKIK